MHTASGFLKKYWVVKSVFKTLKKYWICPKCAWSIEKVWKFKIQPVIYSNFIVYRWWQFCRCFLHCDPRIKFRENEDNDGTKVFSFSIGKVLKMGFENRAGNLPRRHVPRCVSTSARAYFRIEKYLKPQKTKPWTCHLCGLFKHAEHAVSVCKRSWPFARNATWLPLCSVLNQFGC